MHEAEYLKEEDAFSVDFHEPGFTFTREFIEALHPEIGAFALQKLGADHFTVDCALEYDAVTLKMHQDIGLVKSEIRRRNAEIPPT